MKKFSKLLLPVLLAVSVSASYADYDLLVKSNCLACHSIDKRKYGPKLNEVASKYANESSSVDILAKKIKAGGSGVWGEDVMPPQPQLSDENALILAKYILSLK